MCMRGSPGIVQGLHLYHCRSHTHTRSHTHAHARTHTRLTHVGVLCQALTHLRNLVITNRALISSDKLDAVTSDELESAADELQKAVRSAGLSKSHPLVKEAAQLDKPLRDKSTKIKVSALHVV